MKKLNFLNYLFNLPYATSDESSKNTFLHTLVKLNKIKTFNPYNISSGFEKGIWTDLIHQGYVITQTSTGDYVLTDKGDTYISDETHKLDRIHMHLIKNSDQAEIIALLETAGYTLNEYLLSKFILSCLKITEMHLGIFNRNRDIRKHIIAGTKNATVKTPIGRLHNYSKPDCKFKADFYHEFTWDMLYWDFIVDAKYNFKFLPDQDTCRDYSRYDNNHELYGGIFDPEDTLTPLNKKLITDSTDNVES